MTTPSPWNRRFGRLRRQIEITRGNLRLLKGTRCPACMSDEVGWAGKRKNRHCRHCGRRWTHSGRSWVDSNGNGHRGF